VGASLHSDADRGEWVADYVDIMVRAVPTSAIATLFIEDVGEFPDMPIVFFDADAGRWPYAEALGTIAIDEYAASVSVVGRDGFLEPHGLEPDAEADEGEDGGVGRAVWTLTGEPLPEFTAES
jgi:hypothetical protein